MADYVVMLNTIRDNQSALYQTRVPAATNTNFKDIGTALLAYDDSKNEFLNAFVYKICFQEVANRKYDNPWAVLKKGTKPYGGMKEVYHTNPVKGVAFDGSVTSDMLNVTKPDTKTAYFKRNRQDKYPISISDAQLMTAFLNPAEFGKFHQSVLNAMYSGDAMDEYLLMREAVGMTISGGKIKTVEVGADSASLIKAVQTTSRYFKYESAEFAGYNTENATAIAGGSITPVVTWCPTDKQVLLIREDIDVETDIDVLAKAFNMDKTNFTQRKVGIDTFGTGNDDVVAVLADESWFDFEDELYKVASFNNGSNLVTNYWLHHWETIGLNPFANAVAFKRASA